MQSFNTIKTTLPRQAPLISLGLDMLSHGGGGWQWFGVVAMMKRSVVVMVGGKFERGEGGGLVFKSFGV